MNIAFLLIIIGVVFVLIALILFVGKKMCDVAIKAEVAKKYLMIIFTKEQKEAMDKTNEESIEWLNQNSNELEIISKDGLKLVGYEIKAKEKTDIWVIAIHGYMGRGSDMVQYVKKFREEHKCNSLIIDLRAHGKSEGEYIGMGWLDHYDLQIWIDRIIRENEKSKIILYGISMGAATAMMTIGEKIPKNVKLCIEDCGYTSVWEEFSMHLMKIFHMVPFPLLHAASIMSKINIGYGFKEASCIKQLKKSTVPILFIHGKQDKFVPFNMLEKLYKKAKCMKEKLEIEGAIHCESSNIEPEKYWLAIRKFVSEYI